MLSEPLSILDPTRPKPGPIPITEVAASDRQEDAAGSEGQEDEEDLVTAAQ